MSRAPIEVQIVRDEEAHELRPVRPVSNSVYYHFCVTMPTLAERADGAVASVGVAHIDSQLASEVAAWDQLSDEALSECEASLE